MKIKEVKELSKEELMHKKDELMAARYNLRVQAQLGRLEHPHQLRTFRRDIARINTVLNEINEKK